MSQLRPKLKPLLIMLLAAALLFSLVAPAWADDHDGEPVETQDETPTCDHPVLATVVQAMAEADGEVVTGEVDTICQHIEDEYLNQGVGVGQIMKAWYLSQTFSGYVITDPTKATAWEDLLARHVEDGQGWGEVMFAYRFAAALEDSDLTGQELLDMKKSGLGWGQIAKAQALVQASLDPEFVGGPLSLEEAADKLQSGMGWGQLREEFGLEPGPPPWRGRPPWAGGPNKNDVDGDNLENGDESSGSGAPGFAGPPGQNRGNGNGPGNGRGNGPGNGNGNAFGHNKNK